MACDLFLTLSDGIKMPALGYGTWQVTDNALEVALNEALEAGYRHIDTAAIYQNEEVIGKVLKSWFDTGKLSREDVFVTTKLNPTTMDPATVEECLKESLRKLQLDYVDLYLIHFPITIAKDENGEAYGHPDIDYVDVWKKMEEQYDAGRAKTIGISNFNVKKIDRLLKNCRIKPASNQIEVHVYMQQKEIFDFCTKNGITVVAYSPLGCRGYNLFLEGLGRPAKEVRDILDDETISAIAKKHSKTNAQIALRFLLQLGMAPIPKSSTPSRIRENIDVFNFSLDEQDMNALRRLDLGPAGRVCDCDVFGKLREHPDFEL
ncbi:hypothetical protein Trydic_g22127 [Trypoxylus dichotomus]